MLTVALPFYRILTGTLLSVAVTSAYAAPATAPLTAGIPFSEAAQHYPALARSFLDTTAHLQAKAPWLKQFGMSMPAVAARYDGKPYLLFQSCNPQDCEAEAYTIMVDPSDLEVIGGALVRNEFDGNRLKQSAVTWFGDAQWDQAVLVGRKLF